MKSTVFRECLFGCFLKTSNNHQEQVENNQKEAAFKINVIKMSIKNSPGVKKK